MNHWQGRGAANSYGSSVALTQTRRGMAPTECRVGQSFRLSNCRRKEERLSGFTSRRKVVCLPSGAARFIVVVGYELEFFVVIYYFKIVFSNFQLLLIKNKIFIKDPLFLIINQCGKLKNA